MTAQKTAMLSPSNPPLAGSDATLVLTLAAGLRPGVKVKLEVHAQSMTTETDVKSDDVIGTIAGKVGRTAGYVVALDDGTATGNVPPPDPGAAQTRRLVAVRVPGQVAGAVVLYFALPDIPPEGEVYKAKQWVVYVKVTDPEPGQSNGVSVAFTPHAMRVGVQATYDWHAGNQMQFYAHGAARPSAFDDIVSAIGKATKFIFISDWSFHPYFRVKRIGSSASVADTIGKLLVDRANAGVLVGILVWQPWEGSVYRGLGIPGDEQSYYGVERLTAIAGKPLPKNFLWRAANRTGEHRAHSHHQKYVILDQPGGDRATIRAFFGGLDLTKGRWDSGDHPIDPTSAAAQDFMRELFCPIKGKDGFYYDDWYSGEFQNDQPRKEPLSVAKTKPHKLGSAVTMPREPWHDIYGSVTGPSAWDFVREWVGRWNSYISGDRGDLAGVRPRPPSPRYDDFDPDAGSPSVPSSWRPTDKTKLVNDLYDALHDKTKFIQQNEPPAKGKEKDFPWTGQVVRSMVRESWETSRLSTPPTSPYANDFRWVLGQDHEHSIQDAYLNAIGLAEKYVYIETQYFISAGDQWNPPDPESNTIGNRVAVALCDRIEKKRIHVYVITPMYPEGAPDAVPNETQRFYEWKTIEYMIKRVQASMGDWKKYLSFFFPVRNGAPKGNNVFPPAGKLATGKEVMFVDAQGNRTFSDGMHDSLVAEDTQIVPLNLSREDRVQMNNRYMIYVHSKLMIIDDAYILFGSANLNERSLAGNRDTEICVQLWPSYPGYFQACQEDLKAFRTGLFTEHFGASGDPASFAAQAQAVGKANFAAYAQGVPIASGHCVALPLALVGGELVVVPLTGSSDGTEYVFDAAKEEPVWRWQGKETEWVPMAGTKRLSAE
jgi:phospholipase D1/2